MSDNRPYIQINQDPPRRMTDAEYEEYLAEMERVAADMPTPEPTPEERLSALETENAYLKEALELLLSGVTDNA